MDRLTIGQLKAMLMEVAQNIIKNEPYLTEIDTVIGDGDHGTGMKRGFTALELMLEKEEFGSIWELMRRSGMELVKTMGGASGVLFGTLLIGGLDALKDAEYMDMQNAADYFCAGAEAVMRRGGARPGQKTMVDALVPMAEALKTAKAEQKTLNEGMRMAYKAACAGVEETKSMQSGIGRSKNFREKTLGLPDPGAVSVSLIFGAMSSFIEAGAARE